MHHDDAINKVRKLLKLAADKGATPEEAARAAEMAQTIMTRYELDAAVASLQEPEQIQEEVKDFGADPVDDGFGRWRGWLLVAMAKLHGCQAYNQNRAGSKSPALCLIGRPSDVATVRYLYTWIVRQIEEIAVRETRGNGACYAKNFRIGMVETINARMAAAHAAAQEQFRRDVVVANTTTALVVVNSAIALRDKHLADAIAFGQEKLRLRSAGRPKITYDGTARAEGRAAGERVNIGGVAKGGLGAGRKELAS